MAAKDIRTIEFKYSLRPWQREALAGIRSRRFSVIPASRRAGKTELIILHLLLEAMKQPSGVHPAPFYCYISPFLTQSKQIAWSRIKHYASPLILGAKAVANETDLAIKLWNGATIRLFGADNGDRLRGIGVNGVIFDEFSQMKNGIFDEIIRPAMADRENSWAVFIGTPKSMDGFHTLYTNALKDPEKWYAKSFPASEIKVLPEGELELLRQSMPESTYLQEFECDFSVSVENNFILSEEVTEAMNRVKPPVNQAPLVFGVDVSRFGNDRTVVAMRRGHVLEGWEKWNKTDLMTTSSRVAELIQRHQPSAVFVDAVGVGAGVSDRLKQLGFRVIDVLAGAKATKSTRYANKKAELWNSLKEWLGTGVIPKNDELRADLVATKYKFDAQGKIVMESKSELRARGLPSPDLADAICLTFAQPIGHSFSNQSGHRPQFCIMD